MKWSQTQFDPKSLYEGIDPEHPMFEVFPVTDQDVAEAERAFAERQSRWSLALCRLAVRPDQIGYAEALDSPDDTVCCNAARMLFRRPTPAMAEALEAALRARYPGIANYPEGSIPVTLGLVHDGRQGWKPAPGTDWSDLAFPEGPGSWYEPEPLKPQHGID